METHFSNDPRFNYMLLSRYKEDLKYYWGNGNQHAKHLYWGDYDTHVRKAIELWKILPLKPVWFKATELIAYKNRNPVP